METMVTGKTIVAETVEVAGDAVVSVAQIVVLSIVPHQHQHQHHNRERKRGSELVWLCCKTSMRL